MAAPLGYLSHAASVAQTAEQLIRNQQVRSSILLAGSTKDKAPQWFNAIAGLFYPAKSYLKIAPWGCSLHPLCTPLILAKNDTP